MARRVSFCFGVDGIGVHQKVDDRKKILELCETISS